MTVCSGSENEFLKDGREEYLQEMFFNVRKKEKAMIEEWKRFVEEEDDG